MVVSVVVVTVGGSVLSVVGSRWAGAFFVSRFLGVGNVNSAEEEGVVDRVVSVQSTPYRGGAEWTYLPTSSR